MLNFRNTGIAFIALIILVFIAHSWSGLGLIWLVPLTLAFSILLVYGSVYIGSSFYMDVICNGKTTQKQLAITFDDGPCPEFTPQILHVLRKENVQAAFFCVGKMAEANQSLCREIHSQGHILGNHSYGHSFWFDFLSAKKMARELQETDQALRKVTGLPPRFFRPPYGVTNPNLNRAVMAGQYIPVGWNIRSWDTVAKDEKKFLEHIMRSLKPGSIILLHDTKKITADSLGLLIRRIREEGYQIVRLDKLLHLEPYA
jgi:peptidoglycan/xylan/chitin deacetylase (PgdA/CDA1 family)